jgi:uncharacterized protein (TIGR00288 family)
MASASDSAFTIAMFIDLENLAIGVRDARYKSFDVDLVLKRLVDKGNVVVRKAYADWGRYADYKRPLHEARVELLDMPSSKTTGKNSADIKMVVDALELSFTKPHIDCFALVTGDSDFSPLVSKLRENDKHTIGVGVKNSTSPLLIDSCDEFILYDDLARQPRKRKTGRLPDVPEKTREAFALLLDAAEALQREDRELHSSLVKETIKRKQPQFNEEYHGYRSFSRMLEDAEKHNLIKLRKDARSGTYVIEDITEDAG